MVYMKVTGAGLTSWQQAENERLSPEALQVTLWMILKKYEESLVDHFLHVYCALLQYMYTTGCCKNLCCL